MYAQWQAACGGEAERGVLDVAAVTVRDGKGSSARPHASHTTVGVRPPLWARTFWTCPCTSTLILNRFTVHVVCFRCPSVLNWRCSAQHGSSLRVRC